jgi:hypothetical protein
VNRLGEYFFSRSGFAGDQYRQVRTSDLFRFLENYLHLGGCRKDVIESIPGDLPSFSQLLCEILLEFLDMSHFLKAEVHPRLLVEVADIPLFQG